MPFCAHSAIFRSSALWGVAMRIELINLEDGKGDFARNYRPEDLDLGDERVRLSGPTSAEGKVRLAGTELFVNGHIDSCVEIDCDRCLKPIQVPVKSDFELEYITGSEYETNRNVELTEDLLSVSVFDGEALDVDEIVKEQIWLALPARALCRPDCKGFCPTCGKDKNLGECGCVEKEIDPRWAGLKDLMNGK
jgi:uncharacterized protein